MASPSLLSDDVDDGKHTAEVKVRILAPADLGSMFISNLVAYIGYLDGLPRGGQRPGLASWPPSGGLPLFLDLNLPQAASGSYLAPDSRSL